MLYVFACHIAIMYSFLLLPFSVILHRLSFRLLTADAAAAAAAEYSLETGIAFFVCCERCMEKKNRVAITRVENSK